MASFVTSDAHETGGPLALVTVQLTVPVGWPPVLGATSGVTRPLRTTPFAVKIGFAPATITTVVGKVARVWRVLVLKVLRA
jgi:hypothetical protein